MRIISFATTLILAVLKRRVDADCNDWDQSYFNSADPDNPPANPDYFLPNDATNPNYRTFKVLPGYTAPGSTD